MKIQGHDNSLQTNSQSESKNFGIGDASVVIEILRNRLYENKIQTLVQEYICNARDAHREIGKSNNFRITVPTVLEPTFKVRDFGPGITPERMATVFVLYGASTKRTSNNQTGGFGIGAKSAWSYTDSFSIVTVVDGVRRSYVAHTGFNNQGSLDLVSTDPTNEENGTEIQIAVKRENIKEFRNAIFRAIYFWTDRPVLANESEVATLVSGYKFNENVEIVDFNTLPQFLGLGDDSFQAVMGAVIDGILYPIPQKLSNKCPGLQKCFNATNKRLLFHFGNGLVEVSASRESIADSDFTINNLNKMGDRAALLIKNFIAKRFSEVNSSLNFINTYVELKEFFKVDSEAKYKEYTISRDYLQATYFHELQMIDIDMTNRWGHPCNKVGKQEILVGDKISLDCINHVFWMNNTDNSIIQNKRIREYLQKNKVYRMIAFKPRVGLLVPQDPTYIGQLRNKLTEDLGARIFEELPYPIEEKKPKVKVSREDSQFCLHKAGQGYHTWTSLSKNKDQYYYVVMDHGRWPYSSGELRDLSSFLKEKENKSVVGVSEKVAKKIKNDPNFSSLEIYLANYSACEKSLMYVKSRNAQNKKYMGKVKNIKQIDDPFLTTMLEEYKDLDNGAKMLEYVPGLLIEKIKKSQEMVLFLKNDDKLSTIMDKKYPLVTEIHSTSFNTNELMFYINAKYQYMEARKQDVQNLSG